MGVEVTEIILQKLDKIDVAIQATSEQLTGIKVDMATIRECRKTDKQELENFVNKGNQEIVNHMHENYVKKTSFDMLLAESLKKKAKADLENITMWQKVMTNTWDIVKIVIAAIVAVYAYSHGFFAAIV